MAGNEIVDMRKQLVLSEIIEHRAKEKAAQRELQFLRQEKETNDMLKPYVAKLPAKDKLATVQYKHNVYYGVTYAVIAPSNHLLHMAASQLMDGVKPGSITFSVGTSFVNAADGDVYNKKVGRIVSAAKLETVSAKLIMATFNQKEADFVLESRGIKYHFVLSHGKERPFLISVNRNRSLTPYNTRLSEAKKASSNVAKKS